jgi:glycosyltransferase involved in cell wall biosynthesis
MNSWQIVPSLETRHGGPSKSVLGLAESLATAGDQVALLTTGPGPQETLSRGSLEITTYHRDRPSAVCPSRGLRHRLGVGTPDVIHHHSIWLRTLHYAHQAARRTGTPLVISPRGMMDAWAWNHHRKRKAFARALIHPRALEAAAGWHATSEQEAAAIRRLGFQQPICVAPNGVAVPAPAELAAAALHWRAKVPVPEQTRIAVFYSRFHRKKRLLELIDLWLEAAPPGWLLLVAGIPEEYSPKMIEEYVLCAGCAGRVRAFDGFGSPPPYAIASLFILPSLGENFGMSIAEAMASGVPVLVSDSTPWLATNANGAGWCVPWEAFGPALRQATAESPESLARRGKVGRAWMEHDFSWSQPARAVADFYQALRSPSEPVRP